MVYEIFGDELALKINVSKSFGKMLYIVTKKFITINEIPSSLICSLFSTQLTNKTHDDDKQMILLENAVYH